MAEFQVVHDPDRENRGIQCYTFLVDGVPSLKWFHRCHLSGHAPTFYADRCIGRLKKGLSREAFGGPAVMLAGASAAPPAGRGKVYQAGTVAYTSKAGKSVERAAWKYDLDGQCCGETYPTEDAAKAACALAAFMSRGKLGRVGEAQAALEAAHPGCSCKVSVCAKKHKVVAEVDGKPVAVAFTAAGVSFKGG